ncbi:hypothetical protein H0G86_001660 [Trichoderma simmonsii]|uniref:Uncharacterized protein n=1 Tax=Trichoderma simmonsii TaxID=1491479 RepID=A0A8G0PF60_9HYPO|nr:hypothetical protein H0G86_001660 [Trichoderma simmonsii]
MDHDDSVTQQPLMSNMSDETEAPPRPHSPTQESVVWTEEQENSTQQQSFLFHIGDSTEAPPKPQDSSPESDADTTIEQGNANCTTIANNKRTGYLWLTRLASTWWIESITICISFACMATLVCILALFQDRLSTDWSFFISLNATIAIAITAAKATLLATVSVCLSQEKWNRFRNKAHHLQDLAVIDTASRGPLGAIQMLFQVSWGFASISAVVVILSILTDTLVQQVVYLEPGTVYTYQEGSATFGYAYGFNGWEFEGNKDRTDSDLANAILRGIYQSSWPPAFNCTSNCTWDQHYLTLGFSSACFNVTEETVATLECDTGEYWPGPCRMNTPRGGVQFNFNVLQNPPMMINSSEVKYQPFTNLVMDNKSKFIKDSDLFAASIWTRPDANFDSVSLADYKKILLQESMVVECTLGITMYNYSDISSFSNTFNIATTEEIPIGNYSGYTLRKDRESEAHLTTWWNDTGPGLPDIYLSSRFLDILIMFMKSGAFSGTFYPYNSPRDDVCLGATLAFGNGSLEVASNIFDRIAMSLTDMIRQGDSMQIAQGKTSQAVVFIRVRWRWLILPLAVHFLGAIALVGTIIGRSRDVPLWKGSALAVLYHSVDKDGVLGTQVKNLEELDKVKGIQVMLEKKE